MSESTGEHPKEQPISPDWVMPQRNSNYPQNEIKKIMKNSQKKKKTNNSTKSRIMIDLKRTKRKNRSIDKRHQKLVRRSSILSPNHSVSENHPKTRENSD